MSTVVTCLSSCAAIAATMNVVDVDTVGDEMSSYKLLFACDLPPRGVP